LSLHIFVVLKVWFSHGNCCSVLFSALDSHCCC